MSPEIKTRNKGGLRTLCPENKWFLTYESGWQQIGQKPTKVLRECTTPKSKSPVS